MRRKFIPTTEEIIDSTCESVREIVSKTLHAIDDMEKGKTLHIKKIESSTDTMVNETLKTYLGSIGKRISVIDESEAIDEKKENSGRKE